MLVFGKTLKSLTLTIYSILPDIVDNASTVEDITNVFKEKYKEIYTSVPTDDMELETISQDINNLVLTSSNNDSCYITPSIVMSCITSLKSSKSHGELFDYVIIDLCGDTLLTSEMQFGFKPKHSTTLCTTVLKEIINYYVRRNSNIYCCFLYASKAFDIIHFGKLFKTLISKKSPSFSDQINF